LLRSQGAIKGCVASRWFFTKDTSASKQWDRQCQGIFSGHYQTHEINFQAACDYKCSFFVYAALAAPGGANEIAA